MSNHFQTVPLSLKEANAYIATNHRHHKPVVRDKFRLGCSKDGHFCGVVMVGHPVARMLCDGKTVEVVRLCTDGTPNACSFLYSKAARIAADLGFSRIITYILESEPGTSLESAGWTCDGICGGGSWDRPNRRREDNAPTCKKKRYSKLLRKDDSRITWINLS